MTWLRLTGSQRTGHLAQFNRYRHAGQSASMRHLMLPTWDLRFKVRSIFEVRLQRRAKVMRNWMANRATAIQCTTIDIIVYNIYGCTWGARGRKVWDRQKQRGAKQKRSLYTTPCCFFLPWPGPGRQPVSLTRLTGGGRGGEGRGLTGSR